MGFVKPAPFEKDALSELVETRICTRGTATRLEVAHLEFYIAVKFSENQEVTNYGVP